jgi:hypothetical protein
MRNKKFTNLIISNLTSDMKRSFEEKRNISEKDERCQKAIKGLLRKCSISRNQSQWHLDDELCFFSHEDKLKQ